MWLLAETNWSAVIPLVIGIFGVAGLIFTALKYNRDDTTAVVNQQSTILGEMKTLNDELRTRTTELREERDELKTQVERLTTEIRALRSELQEGRLND
jgi:uncharacterized coiled-coil DUF342 family protein